MGGSSVCHETRPPVEIATPVSSDELPVGMEGSTLVCFRKYPPIFGEGLDDTNRETFSGVLFGIFWEQREVGVLDTTLDDTADGLSRK